MIKGRFLVRKLEQAVPNTACVCFESYHSTIELACVEFDIALYNARLNPYVLIEICEIGDDDDYHPIKSVKLDWL